MTKLITPSPEKLAKVNWLKDCEICNVGLIKAVDTLVEQGMSINAACHQLADDVGGLHASGVLRTRYNYYKKGKTGGSKPHPADLQERLDRIDSFNLSHGTRQLMKTSLILLWKASDSDPFCGDTWVRYYRADMLAWNAINAERGLPPLYAMSGSHEEQQAIDLMWEEYRANKNTPIKQRVKEEAQGGAWWCHPESRETAIKHFARKAEMAETIDDKEYYEGIVALVRSR